MTKAHSTPNRFEPAPTGPHHTPYPLAVDPAADTLPRTQAPGAHTPVPFGTPQAWTHTAAGRVTAWEWLERNWMAAGYPPLAGDMQKAAWRVVGAIYDAKESFCTIPQAHHTIAQALALGSANTAKSEGEMRDVLVAMLHQGAAISLAATPAVGARPSVEADALFGKLGQAARPVARRERMPHFVQVTENNVVLGPLLHGGDEIWAAAGMLIERAELSVAIQVWSYYRRSEAAKHIMSGLVRLLKKQAQRRAKGALVRPIEVVLLTGCLDEDLGLEHHTGGLSAHQTSPDNSFHTAHYCIFPCPIDPELMHVVVLTQKRDERGNDRSKTVIIDDTLALVGTANVQGNHHRVSSDNVPLHDLGFVLSGDVVGYSLVAQMRYNIGRGHVLADNIHEKHLSFGDITETLEQTRTAHTPLTLDDAILATWLSKQQALTRALDEQTSAMQMGPGARIISLVQPAQTLVFASNRRTAYQRGILAALDAAKHCIDINHSTISAPPVVQALKAALSRGVDICLMAADAHSDTVSRQAARRRKHIFDILAAHKVRTHAKGQIRLRWQRHAYFGHTFRNSHAKAMFVDGQVAIVGTVNLDAEAWRHAGELGLVLHAPALVEQLWRALFIGFWDAARRKLDADDTFDERDDADEVAVEGAETAELAGAPVGQPKQVTMDSLAHARAPGRFVDVLFHRALISNVSHDKTAYLSGFNKYFAPRISTEEAALERLAVKHIRLSLPPQTAFAFNIRRNTAHQPVTDYAASYVVADTLVDPEEGLRAYLLQPHTSLAQPGPPRGRHIIVYEGTTVRKDAIRQLAQHPTGRRSATDPRGLGYKAFAASRARLLAWSHAAQAQGTQVTLLGFSLGGVQAARHWHALSDEGRSCTRLITFAMPGLDRRTAEQMAGPHTQENIRHFRVYLDPFSKVGQSRAPGRIVRYAGRRPYPSLANHTWAYLSEREIDGLPLELQFDTGHDDDPLSPRLDRFRRFWGLFRPAR